MKIKPQRRSHINLCSLNKTICLGLSVWRDYVKIICSLEDHPNCQSCPTNPDWWLWMLAEHWEGYAILHNCRAYNYVCITFLHIRSCSTEHEDQHYLLSCVAQATCGKESPSTPCRNSFTEATGWREKMFATRKSHRIDTQNTPSSQELRTSQLQKGEIHKKEKRLKNMLNVPN